MAWKIARCDWEDKTRLNGFLEASWEPFAVTETDAIPTVWLRRETEPKDAKADVEPQRFARVTA